VAYWDESIFFHPDSPQKPNNQTKLQLQQQLQLQYQQHNFKTFTHFPKRNIHSLFLFRHFFSTITMKRNVNIGILILGKRERKCQPKM
jgi:hypothetical protein